MARLVLLDNERSTARVSKYPARTARARHRELCLGESRARFETCLEDFAAATNGWFWETDENHRFVFMSASVRTVSGVAPEWHYGKTREELGSPDGVTPEQWAKHLRTIHECQPFENFVYRRLGPDRIQWLRTSGRPFFSEEGAFQGYRGTATDITAEVAAKERAEALVQIVRDREKTEEVLAQAVSKLTSSNKRQKELSMILAHDLRSPLASVHDVLGALHGGHVGTIDPQASEYIRKCIETLDRMMSRVSDGVDAAVNPECVEEPVDLNAAVASALKDLDVRDIRMKVDPLPKVLGCPNDFRAIFFNLLSNAHKYRAADRPLTVAVRSSYQKPDRICVEIEDNGQGVEGGDLNRIFDLGYRAQCQQSVAGTGKGLAFVKSALTRLGGAVTATSKPGVGTTICLEIPAPRS